MASRNKAVAAAKIGPKPGYCSRVLQGFEDWIPGKKSKYGVNIYRK
jgi:hypothetical protein